MKILWACPSCQRQYDISGLKLGSHFRCSCQNTVQVPNTLPTVRDVAVSHCAACGAAREKAKEFCTSCQSAFKLFEKDQSTMCPCCFARMSDNAHYCHSCGESISPHDLTRSEATDLDCPACQKSSQLQSRRFHDKIRSLLECSQCGGHFISAKDLEHVVLRSEELSIPELGNPKNASLSIHSKGPFYRKCPFCKNLMNRKNFANHSGVLIDVCKEHGIWLDAHEIQAIVDWVKKGGLQKARAQEKENLELERKRENSNRQFDRPVDLWDKPEKKSPLGAELDLFATVAEIFIDLIIKK